MGVKTSSSAPSVPLIVSQCAPSSDDGFLTLGCVTSGFFPADSLSFSWTDSSGGEPIDVVQYPAVQTQDGKFTAVSHARVKLEGGKTETFTCQAGHPAGNQSADRNVTVPAKPTVRLGEIGQTILCVIEDFQPSTVEIQWKQDDQVVSGKNWTIQGLYYELNKAVSVFEANQTSSGPGTTYTCEVTHMGKQYVENLTSTAHFSVKVSPPQAKELFINKKAVITCVISGDIQTEVEGATVSWTVGGKTETSTVAAGAVAQLGSSFTKTHTLIIDESRWFRGEEVICTGTVGKQSKVDKISVKRGGTRPSITLYKPDKSVRDSDTVSLVCEISSSDVGDVYIMWQVNGGQYMEGNGMTNIVKNDNKPIVLSSLTVTGQQYNSADIACVVKDANMQNDYQPRSSTPSKPNSPPKIHLEEFGKSIMCIIKDFYPKALTIKWKKNDRDVQGREWKTTESDSGSYRAVSVLDENLASSSPGTKYTCEVTHGGRTYSENVLSKAQISLKINPPQAKDLFLTRKAVIQCVIHADIQMEVQRATVSWTVGGSSATRDVRNGDVTKIGSSFTKTSTLTIDESVWFSGKELICSASVGQITTSEKISVKRGGTRPSITLYKPEKSVNDSDTVSLVCEVSSSDVGDVYIMWQVNGGQYMEGNGMTNIVKNDNKPISLSSLTVTGQQYNSADIACVVKDANMQNDYQPKSSTPSKTNSPPKIHLVEFGQSIMCIIKDFYPKALTIKWKKNDGDVQGREWKTTESDSGSYRAVSVLDENLASSSPGTKYTCEVTHGGRTYSENVLSKAEFALKINPPQAKELFINRKAVIGCVINGENEKEVREATVSWTVGGTKQTLGISHKAVTQIGSSFTKTSTLTIDESVWFSGKEVICSTSVGQKSTSEKISVKRGGTRPSITLYKPEKSVNDSDSVSLVCEVSSSDVGDVYIMWQVNGGQYMEGNGMTNIVKNDNKPISLSSLTVTGQQYNSADITCVVKDANMQNDYQPRSSTPSKPNSPPKIHLVEFGQSIMCIIKDFYPKALTIKWKKNDRDVQGREWKTTESDSGSYRAVSVLDENLASSSPGTKYTCEVTHGGRTYSENVLSKAEFALKINPPQAKELFINRKAVIGCVINGENEKEVREATVSWTVGGTKQTLGISHKAVAQIGSSFTKTSTLTIDESVWFSGKEVICSASVGQKSTSEKISVKKGGTRPSITLYKPEKSVNDSDSVSLVCEVSSSDVGDVYLMWQVNGGQYMEGNGMTNIVKNDNKPISLSSLTVTGQQYNSADIACVVKDANMQNDYQPRSSTPSKTNSPPNIHLVEFGQSIMCIIKDFYPKALTIKWKKNDRDVQGREWKTTESDSGSYRAISVLDENLASSSPGTKYTCEVIHGGRTYSENVLSKAQISLKINPPQAKDLFLTRKAVIQCVIHADIQMEVQGATVSWTVGGSSATRDVRNGDVTKIGSSFTKTSTLTIDESVWFSGKEVICSTSVGQITTSEKISVKKGGTRPSITLYKPEESVNDSDTVSLVCEVSSSDVGDVYIMWQVNGGQYMEGNGMTNIIINDNKPIVLSSLTVTGQQYDSADIACVVKDANMQNDFQPRSSTPSKTNSPPKIHLVEFGQSIMCIIKDFYPKALTINWKKNDRDVQGREWKTTESDSGSYRAISVLDENLASSSPGTKYTCEVTHGGRTYSENVLSKAEFALKINPPQAKELFINRKAVIGCVINGENEKEVREATVSWTVGGNKQTLGISHKAVTQIGSSFTKTSTLTIDESVWFSGKNVVCSASVGPKSTSEKISVKRGGTRPSITLYKPDKSVRDSDTVSLVCEVSSSDVGDVYIMWQIDGGQYMEGNGMTNIVKNDNKPISLSSLTVTGQQYNSADIACVVKDANMQNDYQPRSSTPSKTNSPPNIHLVEFGQSIMCIIKDFYPKALTIKWKKNDGDVQGREWKTTESDSGSYRAVSVLDENLASSSPGTKYTCEVTHGGRTYSENLSSKADFSLKINPPQAKELFINRKAVIGCVINGEKEKEVKEATVSWTVGGNKQTLGISHKAVTQIGSSFTKTSTLTIDESVWFSGKEVVCSASVGQKSTSEKISVKKGGTRPSITLHKPDKSVRDSDTVSLVCEVSSSDVGDVYIMWQVNGGQYMEGNGMTNIVKNDNKPIVLSSLTVTGQQYNSADIACVVKDANMQNDYQPRSSTPSKTNSPPKIHLVEFGQSLMCVIKDFYPKALTIKWKKNDRDVQGREWKTTESDSGSYRAVSVLNENLASSSTGTKYTCEVTHGGRTYSENLSYKAQLTLKINPPQAKELFINKKAIIKCVINGDNRKEVNEMNVTWAVKDLGQESLDVQDGGVTQTGPQFSKTSILTIDESVWFSGKEVSCSTSKDQNTLSDKISVKKGGRRPSVTIYKLDDSKSDLVSLVCKVSSSDLADVYVTWQIDGGQYMEGNSTATTTKSDNTLIVLSSLTVTGQQYNSAKFACAVKDGNMETGSTPTTTTTSNSELPCPDPESYVEFNEDTWVEDDFNSLWSTASSFIFLFLFSLIYSTVLCLVKMKS